MPMKNVVGCWGRLSDQSDDRLRALGSRGNSSVGKDEPFWPSEKDETDDETDGVYGECIICIYQGMVYSVPCHIVRAVTLDERNLLIKHHVLRQRKHFERIRREIDAFENFECEYVRREQIPERVRLFVWQRDEGKCIQCGSRELLEFDHIIPRAEGGASTERNVQLLCMPCNRSKGKRI